MPWIFTKYLQDTFKVPLYFQLTGRREVSVQRQPRPQGHPDMAYQNLLDVIARGFDPKLTRIRVDTEYIHSLYPRR
jgi:tryptophanyl-tRNA synthetase